MNTISSQFDEFERYLQKAMSAEEERTFEENLEKDPKLASEFKQYKLANLAVKTYNKELRKKELLKKGQQAFKRIEEGKEPFRSSGFPFWAIGLAVFVIVALCVTYASVFYSNKSLATKYYVSPFEKDVAGSSVMDDAETAFFDKNYLKAIEGFSNIPETDPLYYEAQWYIAHSHFQLKEYDEAQRHLTIVYQSEFVPGVTSPERLKWNFQLLNFLTSSDEESLRNSLETDTNLSGKEQALKQDLDSFWRSIRLIK